MPVQPDAFDEFLRKVDPLMEMYGSLEFACVAAKVEDDWILISGKAALTIEPPPPAPPRIPFLARFDNFAARSGRLMAESVVSLVANLREEWVIETSAWGPGIRLMSKGQSPYAWRLPGITSVGSPSSPPSRWSREFVLYGDGPNPSSLLSYAAWQEIDSHLRKISPNPFKDFDALCSRLKLPARRGNLQSSFSLSAELPARFKTVTTGSAEGTLEIDIECVGAPDVMVDWLPEHKFERVPQGWRSEPTGDHHHVSISVPGGAAKADLLLSFGDLDADSRTIDVVREQPAPPEPAPRSDRTQAHGRWKIVGKRLGPGGQGEVFPVEDTLKQHKGHWALKKLVKTHDQKARQRFGQEVKAVQSINHHNILRIVDSDLGSEGPYFVAEYCEGGSLQTIGASRFKGDIRATMRVALPVVDAIVAAHQANPGVIHRDIKPANILFRKDGTPVVGDFGICFIEDTQGLTSLGEAVGARHFIAPEMESGGRDLGPPTDRTDVYSVGKLLYWMLSGGLYLDRERHRANSLAKLLNDQRWEHVHSLLDKMVAERPEDRLQSVQLKEQLQMAASLVEGNFAPLSPSIGIRCRFCGIGSYEPTSSYAKDNSYRVFGLTSRPASDPSGQVALLTCTHCGHIEWFQLEQIKCKGWWDK